MLVNKTFELFFGFITGLLDMLPVMDISVDLSVLNTFLDIVGSCLYFFPWQKVAPILAIIILLQVWRILVSIIKVIWQLLPIL